MSYIDDEFESASWDEGFENQTWDDLMSLVDEATARVEAMKKIYPSE